MSEQEIKPWEIDFLKKVHDRQERELLEIRIHEYYRNYSGRVPSIAEEEKNRDAS